MLYSAPQHTAAKEVRLCCVTVCAGGLAPSGSIDHSTMNNGWTDTTYATEAEVAAEADAALGREASSAFTTRLNLVVPGVADDDASHPMSWLEPVPGRPAHFRLKQQRAHSNGTLIRFVPYFEIGAEHFTCFPLFALKG